jgi:hypothetical protein
MKTKLFNPFIVIAGNKALWLGIGAMLVTAVVCIMGKVHLDGVIDIHAGKEAPAWLYIAEPFIDWACFVIPLYIFGRSFSASSIRIIDVAGTAALARCPMIFAVIFTMLMPIHAGSAQQVLQEIQASPALLAKILLFALLSIPFIIWTIALMYNAYSVSVNLKGPKAIWSFIASLLIAEIISKCIFYCITGFHTNLNFY